jgi:GNAT superfamily N-acetyltransferase
MRPAQRSDLPALVRYVQAAFRQRGVGFNLYRVERGLLPLLSAPDRGRLWIIEIGGRPAGCLALCFGHSLEFGGRDGTIDEFFIDESFRGRGAGRAVLKQVMAQAATLDLRALNLALPGQDERIKRLFESAGFRFRERTLLLTASLAE